jgi:predicted ATPase/DNA-binding winged helix-turn-helix (wHTH) protein
MKQFESFRLDTQNECLWCDGAQIPLPPKQFGILRYLVENPGRLITHDELLDHLWPETYVQPQVLRTYVLELRKVLGDDVGSPRYIQTVPKRGYTFVARVTESAEARIIAFPPAFTLPPPEPDSCFIDREDEMRRLQAALDAATQGQRQVVCVAGGAGIGKTALVDAFLRRNQAAPVTVARGQCVEALGAREEYYPVMEALAHLCASPDGDRACRVLARVAPGWLPPGSDDPAASPESAPARSVRMPGELCSAFEELAADKPFLLVFEDLHWADEATLGVVSALARRRTPGRLMLLITYRALDGTADPALKLLKQDLLMRRLCIELNLGPLDREAVIRMLSRELGQEALPQGLAEFVYERSEGNPLFVKAMLEHLIAERYITRDQDGPWRQRGPFPESESGVPAQLSQMIELEIERLGADDQRILEAASLMTVVFPAWAVAAALEEDPAEIDEACDDLARRLYFVRRAGEDELPDGSRSAFYVFAHGLYREVLYQRQSASRRARRHTRIAERLAELFAGREANVAPEMAMHYEAAGNWQRAVSVLVSAAQDARERLAAPEAEALLERALRLAENVAGPQRRTIEDEIRAELGAVRG